MNTTQISKLISLVLRHHPERLGLALDAHGWADTSALIDAINAIQPFDMEQLEAIVRADLKQRYAFSPDKARIRANQGHSIPVDLELKPRTPPAILWHGTGERFVSAILREGLKPMGRQYVHLSADPDTAVKVGRRHGRPVLFTVDAVRMAGDGLLFYRSENGVWLTDAVPPQYLKKRSTLLDLGRQGHD